jgi:hypothetical protein
MNNHQQTFANNGANPLGRRAASRLRLGVPGRIKLLRGIANCCAEDLSRTGARVSKDGDMPRPGSTAIVEINGVEGFGSVVWVKGQHMGMKFDDPLSLETLVVLRHYADNYRNIEVADRRRNAREFVMGMRKTV